MASATNLLDQFRGLSFANVGSWPLLPRLIVWVILVAICVALGWTLLWRDQVEQLDRLRADEVQLKNQYKAKVAQAINLDELSRQRDQVAQYVQTLEKQLPSKAEMDALLSDINQAGVGRGLQFELFRPGSTALKDYHAELPIAVRITGRYHDLGAFAADIAALPRIVVLHNLGIDAGREGGLSLDATARTFRYLDEEELAAQRKSRAAGKKG